MYKNLFLIRKEIENINKKKNIFLQLFLIRLI